jgi:hypothetical protein
MYASTKAARRLLLERLTKVVAELKRRPCQGHRALRGVVAIRTSACCSSTHPRLPALVDSSTVGVSATSGSESDDLNYLRVSDSALSIVRGTRSICTSFTGASPEDICSLGSVGCCCGAAARFSLVWNPTRVRLLP